MRFEWTAVSSGPGEGRTRPGGGEACAVGCRANEWQIFGLLFIGGHYPRFTGIVSAFCGTTFFTSHLGLRSSMAAAGPSSGGEGPGPCRHRVSDVP